MDAIIEMGIKTKRKNSIPNRKIAKNGFTGVNNDRPGPEGYNPKL